MDQIFRLTPGTHFGPYEITAPLGAGGMGEVYRARDTRLGREVAIKVSSASFTDLVHREARAVAALNHPNICTLHDVGPNYLVMELIDGLGLNERIQQGPLPPDEALRIAIQIAEALEAAHVQGIVHRDLKPANVKIKPDGTVKVLDFGVSTMRLATTTAADVSATLTRPATEYGLIVGTAAYMSPEQSRGMSVDKRTDIWAFGCLVFEMLTGRRAFDGATVGDVFAEVVKTEPDWGALPRLTPPLVSALLRRCLRKDPVHRLHDIADARIEIQEALGNGSESELGAQSPVATKVRMLAPWAIATLSLVALFATQVAPRRLSLPPGVTRLEMTFPPDVEPYIGPAALAFSPDGSRVAFVAIKAGNRQLYVRRLDEFEAEPVPGMEGATAVFFSPSGRSLAVISTNRTMKRISLDDALVVPLTTDVDFTAGGAWGPDDLITFGRDGVLWQIPVAGGTATQLTTLDRNKGEVLHAFPTALANGKGLLFATVTGPGRGAAHIEALSTSGGAVTRHRLVESATSPAYVESGRLIFFRDGILFASPFDQEGWAVTGAPVKVIEQIGATASGAPMWAVSRSGSVAFMRGTVANRLGWGSRNGQERPLTTPERQYMFPRLSATREQLVVSAGGDLWLQDTTRQVSSRVTTESTTGNTYPAWTPDGSRIVFRTNTGLYSTAADGSGRSELLPGTTAADFPNSISPDNDTLIFLRTTGATAADLYVTSLRGSQPPRAWVATTAHEGGAQFSPDGKWVAYASNEAGQFQVFLRPFPQPDRKWLVAQTGKYVTWNRNGRELLYRDGDNMMAVRVSFRAGEPTFSVPALVFTGVYEFGIGQTVPNYDVSTDGQEFLMVKAEPGSSRLNVVLHAFDGLTTPPKTSR